MPRTSQGTAGLLCPVEVFPRGAIEKDHWDRVFRAGFAQAAGLRLAPDLADPEDADMAPMAALAAANGKEEKDEITKIVDLEK